MPKPKKKTCHHCGASMMQHRQTISRTLIEGLAKLAEHDGPVNLKKLGLSRSAWDNAQKLRYWGLIQKEFGEGGRRLAGVWSITDLGRRFMRGEAMISKHVRTYRGETQSHEGPEITIDDVAGNLKRREKYAREATPHTDAGKDIDPTKLEQSTIPW